MRWDRTANTVIGELAHGYDTLLDRHFKDGAELSGGQWQRTHRLASVRHGDRIYVLRDGQVIEQGVHAGLMALGGQYAELFTLQASQYDP